MDIELINNWQCFGGSQKVFSHNSHILDCRMEFSVFIPTKPSGKKLPVLYYLSGLTCNWENAVSKAGAQRYADETGVMLVFPDTSPRGEQVPDNADDYSFGKGAGFYLNATREPWVKNYRMYDYVVKELREIIHTNFEMADKTLTGITGHSMGGHGALTIALKNPDIFKSVSAFAPIVSPIKVPWGQKAFTGYLGENQADWEEYDACRLLLSRGWKGEILIDQGTADNFLGKELLPDEFSTACADKGVNLTLRMQENYDHSYYFISTFIGDHIRWHADRLK